MVVLLFCLACRALRTPRIADVYNVRASGWDSSHDSSDSSVQASSASPSYCRLLLRLVDFLDFWVTFVLLGFAAALDASMGACCRDRERSGWAASGGACLVASANVLERDCECAVVAAASHLVVRRCQMLESRWRLPVVSSKGAPISRHLEDHLRMKKHQQSPP